MVSLVKSIPALLHISVFFFLAGLVEFLFPINLTIACLTLSIAAVCLSLYIAITFLPTMYRNCPYQTPFSELCWRILQASHLLGYYSPSWRKFILLDGSMTQGREFLAMESFAGRNQRDREALRETLESLTEHSEFEPFVEGIPGFIRSNEVADGRSMFQELLLDRTSRLESRIARLLLTCKDMTSVGGIGAGEMENRALSCLNAIFSLTKEPPSSPWNWLSCFGENTAYSLRIFRSSGLPIVAHHASCTHALVINKLLVDISTTLTMIGRNPDVDKDLLHMHGMRDVDRGFMQDLDRGIYAMQFLGARSSLEYSVGLDPVDSDGKVLRWTRLLEVLRSEMLASGFDSTENRRMVTRGRIHALCEFIKVLMTFSPLPDESQSYHLTCDTIRAITTDVVAHHADAESEWLLVHLLDQVISVPPETRLPSDVINVLIRVFTGLRNAETREEAKRLVKSYGSVGTPGEFVGRVLLALNASDIYQSSVIP